MSADPSQVIVTTGFTPHAVQVHHRYIPELNADGESPESAAANLAQDLAREIEHVLDTSRRAAVQRGPHRCPGIHGTKLLTAPSS